MKNILGIIFTIILTICLSAIKTEAFAKEFTPHKYTVVKASHILVPTETKAKTLKTMINEGEDFAYLARQYSQCPSKSIGGDLGYFKRGQMVKEFETVAFDLPIGAISDPVQTQFGWHLIKVVDKK